MLTVVLIHSDLCIFRWTYVSEDVLDGSSHWGLISRYGGGGFVQNLGLKRNVTEDILAELKEYLWLDRGTRSVFLDFTVYNANINLFCVIRLVYIHASCGN